MHIQCTNGSPIVNTLDHLPLLPLSVQYHDSHHSAVTLAPLILEQDELGIYLTLQSYCRIRDIGLFLPPSILHKALTLMNGNFPILEHLSLSGGSFSDRLRLTLPKGFLAPNLRHLTLSDIGPTKRLRVLTSTVSLVTLTLRDIQTSSYFRPRLLVARLRSLPLLEELTIEFSIPIPRPSTERELLGEEGAPITLPSLKTFQFVGVGAYLESLVTQIRVPLLEKLHITLFNQIAFVLPHLSHLINNTIVFKVPYMKVSFHHDVHISTARPKVHTLHSLGRTAFSLSVKCKPLDWQIDCAAQICDALIPTLSGVRELSLLSNLEIATEIQNSAIDSATWHDLLRSFVGVKELYIGDGFPENLSPELSRALQVGEVGSDPSFLPNLRSIHATHNLFTSFIDTRQIVGRPVRIKNLRFRL